MVALGVWPGEPRRPMTDGGYRPVPVVRPQEDPRVRSAQRHPFELRPMLMRMGTVSEAAGSCYMECGRSKVLCSVYGPRPDPRAAHFSNTVRIYLPADSWPDSWPAEIWLFTCAIS